VSPRERTEPVIAPTRGADGTLSTPSGALGCRRARSFIPDEDETFTREAAPDDEREDVFRRIERRRPDVFRGFR
jgi:hypothetical protein